MEASCASGGGHLRSRRRTVERVRLSRGHLPPLRLFSMGAPSAPYSSWRTLRLGCFSIPRERRRPRSDLLPACHRAVATSAAAAAASAPPLGAATGGPRSNDAGLVGLQVAERVQDGRKDAGEELADTYEARNAYAYGRDLQRAPAQGVLDALLWSTNAAVPHMDSVEYRLDGYVVCLGGGRGCPTEGDTGYCGGKVCGRPRTCGHPCNAVCHPGPCSDCEVPVTEAGGRLKHTIPNAHVSLSNMYTSLVILRQLPI